MKIAIIRLSSLGDIIITAVFLDFIKNEFSKKYGSVHITWIVDSSFKGILESSSYIDDICDIPLRNSKKNKILLFGILKKIRSLGYFDLVIDFQGLIKSAIIGKLLKYGEFVGYSRLSAREGLASIFYTSRVNVAYNEHVLKRQYAILKSILSLDSDFNINMLSNRRMIFQVSKDVDSTLIHGIESKLTNILFVLEASKPEKEYPLDLFYDVAMGIKNNIPNTRIYLIWNIKEDIIKQFGERDDVFYVLDKLDFNDIKFLIANMNLVIGGDTGITHLSWALDVPSITLYGNTPMQRFELTGSKFISLASKRIDEIIKDDFCISNIPPKQIINSALLLLGHKDS